MSEKPATVKVDLIELGVLGVKDAEERKFKCSYCSKSFLRKFHLDVHTDIHLNVRRYECSICHKKFKQQSHLSSHLETHSEEKKYECFICSRKFVQKKTLDKHIRVHGEISYECIVCGSSFASMDILESHIDNHIGEESRRCLVCHRIFASDSCLKSHMDVHDGELGETQIEYKPYSVSNGMNHEEYFGSGTDYLCITCHRYFPTKDYLEQHMIKYHIKLEEEGIIPSFLRLPECSICSEGFSTKEEVTNHWETAHEKSMTRCEICNMKLHRNNLKRHLRVHEKKKHVCQICGEEFVLRSELMRHLKIHQGIQTYECDICKKKLTSKHNLKRHFEVHMNDMT